MQSINLGFQQSNIGDLIQAHQNLGDNVETGSEDVRPLNGKQFSCDLEEKGVVHKLVPTRLVVDPLGRKVEDGEAERLMKLCKSCYKQALILKQTQKGMTCDLQKRTGVIHNLGSSLLCRDPLGRTVKERVGGKKIERVMKLCSHCYERAKAIKQSQEGMICDLQEKGWFIHKLKFGRLRGDPLGRMVKSDEVERLMRLCDACYRKALRKRKEERSI